MLSETPKNDAVNFVTGAGGFLQQVIYGWTGLRIGERRHRARLPAAAAVQGHPPGAPQRAEPRQALRRDRGFHRPPARAARGRPLMLGSLALSLLLQAAQVTPVLGFPEPGVDDPGGVPGLPDPLLSRLQAECAADLPRAAGRAGGTPLGRRGEREHRIHRARPGGEAGADDLGRRGGRRGRLRRRPEPGVPPHDSLLRRSSSAGSCWAPCGWSGISSMPGGSCSRSRRRRSRWRRSRCWWRRCPGFRRR